MKLKSGWDIEDVCVVGLLQYMSGKLCCVGSMVKVQYNSSALILVSSKLHSSQTRISLVSEKSNTFMTFFFTFSYPKYTGGHFFSFE